MSYFQGMIDESEELKRTREQICALSAETRIPGDVDPGSSFIENNVTGLKV